MSRRRRDWSLVEVSANQDCSRSARARSTSSRLAATLDQARCKLRSGGRGHVVAQFLVVRVASGAPLFACPEHRLLLCAARALVSSTHRPSATRKDQESITLARIVLARGPPCPVARTISRLERNVRNEGVPDGTTRDRKAPAGAPKSTDPASIRPFRVNVPEADLIELRRRVAATRWPEKETVNDPSQGVQLAFMQALARYWATDYDWRRCEAQLNSHPQFITEIDGLDIHFIHVRSRHEVRCRSSSPTAGLARRSSS